MAKDKSDRAQQNPDEPQHDLGPWIEAPQSSRVAAYRYDYAAGDLQVKWQNGKGHEVTAYHVSGKNAAGVSHSGATTYRKFAIAVSKGKYVNSTLEGFTFTSLKNSTDKDLPSNPNRRMVQHRD